MRLIWLIMFWIPVQACVGSGSTPFDSSDKTKDSCFVKADQKTIDALANLAYLSGSSWPPPFDVQIHQAIDPPVNWEKAALGPIHPKPYNDPDVEYWAVINGPGWPKLWHDHTMVLRLNDVVLRIDDCRIRDFLVCESEASGCHEAPRGRAGQITKLELLLITPEQMLSGQVSEVELVRNGKRIIVKVPGSDVVIEKNPASE